VGKLMNIDGYNLFLNKDKIAFRGDKKTVLLLDGKKETIIGRISVPRV
jgi:hypothetical protein